MRFRSLVDLSCRGLDCKGSVRTANTNHAGMSVTVTKLLTLESHVCQTLNLQYRQINANMLGLVCPTSQKQKTCS